MTSTPRLRCAMSAIVVLAACVIGCEAPASTGKPVIRVSYGGQLNMDDLPAFLAHIALRAEGYAVEEISFAVSELSTEALMRGDLEFASGSVRSFWAAAGRGARIRTVMEHVTNGHRLVAHRRITSCRDLDGRQVAIQSEAAAGTALFRAYLAEECPGVHPQVLFVPQSENRATAMLSGNLDAAVLELSFLGRLDQQAPGQFHVVENFAARWPLVKVTGVQVNMDFARRHPDVVRDYVRARVSANRAVLAKPSLLVAEATRNLGESAAWPSTVRTYLDGTAWAPTGGLTALDVERSLEFFKRSSGLKPDLTIADVADLSFLDTVLADSHLTSPNGAQRDPR